MKLVTRSAIRLMRWGPVQRMAFARAARLGRRLILLYHRLGHRASEPHEIVPTVPVEVFRRHLDVLQTHGQVVSLDELLDSAPAENGLRFALTFDDDEPCHVETALPALKEAGVVATFFLSGRDLGGLGAYWWQVLESAIANQGLAAVSGALGLKVGSPLVLAESVENQGLQGAALALGPSGPGDVLGLDGIRALSEAGMTIGFHTLRHPVLTQLEAHELPHALTESRSRLASALGIPIDLIAYPHGKANRTVAAAARAAGYRAAFTDQGRRLDAGADRFLLPRWEPTGLDPRVFRSALAARLSR